MPCLVFFIVMLEDSANAVLRYQKLYTRVPHVWGNRRGQPIRSAMDGPHPGGTSFVINVSPVPGKYATTGPTSRARFAAFPKQRGELF